MSTPPPPTQLPAQRPKKPTPIGSAYVKTPETLGQSVYKISLWVLMLVMILYATWMFHSQCGNGWVIALVKSVGVQCVSTVLLSAITAIFAYWAASTRNRGGTAKVSTAIAKTIMPTSNTGMLLHVVLVLVLLHVLLQCSNGDVTGNGVGGMTMYSS